MTLTGFIISLLALASLLWVVGFTRIQLIGTLALAVFLSLAIGGGFR